MVLLRLFGGASIESGEKPITGRSAQRRRIALLALLALARRGLTRDKLIGYLWAESDMEKARRLLSESLYVVRREMGEDAITVAGDELRLNSDVISCDVIAFEEAVERNDLETAATLYAGPLLDGFYVSDALELERWIDTERDRLARAYGRVLEKLAETATVEGRRDDAVGWWRRMTELDPFSGRFAVGLMQALEAAGNRAAALQHASVQRTLLREELDAEPDPAVAALAERLRDSPDPTWTPPVPVSHSGTVSSGDTAATGAPERPIDTSPTPVPPGATVTFLFSDIEGSTSLLRRLGPKYGDLLATHHAIIRECLRRCHGREIDTAGDGFFIAFPRARDAAGAAVAIRKRFSETEWPDGVTVRVRMGLHTGEPASTSTGFVGLDVHRAARIAGLARGAQILLSSVTRELIAGDVPAGTRLRDHGTHALKDIDEPEHLWVLEPEGAATETPAVAASAEDPAFSALLANPSPAVSLGMQVPVASAEAGAPGGRATGAPAGRAATATVGSLLVSRVLRPRRMVFYAVGLIALIVAALQRDFWWPGAGPDTANVATADPGIRVVIVPFRCAGCRTELDYLPNGLMHKLFYRLHGLGPIDVTSPDQVLRESKSLLESDANRIRRRFAATHVIIGTITESGGVLTVTADLTGPLADGTDATTAGTEGSLEGVESIAGALASDVIVALIGGRGRELAMQGVRALTSPQALSAWVRGEEEFAAARYPQAVEAFEEVVHAEPAFAHGHYRLSMAREWNFDFLQAHESADLALTHSVNLPPRQQGLIRAWHALLNGRVDEAERLYGRIRTDQVEALYGLGEVHAHFSTPRGESIAPARELFREVINVVTPIDSAAGARRRGYGDALYHLLEFAAADRNLAEYDSLLAAVDTTSPQHIAFEAVRAFGWGEDDDKAAMLEKLEDQLEEVKVGTAAARVAAHLHDFDGARRIARIVAEKSGYSADWRAGGRLLMAEFSFASGRFEEAFADVDTAGRLESQWPRELRGLFALPGFVELTPERLNEIRDDLEGWSPSDSTPSGAFFFGVHGYVHKHLRLYLLGMLDVRLGELARADSIRRELASGFAGPHGESLRNALVTSLRAHIARAGGDEETALKILETIAPVLHAWMEQVGFSPFYSRAYDRLVMAELYREKEEYGEALSWYRSLTEGYEGLFVAPAHYRMAEILRLQGRADEAQVHMDEFDRLWSTADPAARRGLSSPRW